ncbi:MAG: oligoendopeptidase F, partial [Rhodospirillaceae bacterium]|nr:oligoendopeptidase F [Rhodospirillaceae bacterium]
MKLGNLPRWDLSDLYSGPDAADLAADLDKAATAAEQFNGDFAGKVGTLSAADLARAIQRYERDEDFLGRIASYAQLYHAANIADREVGRFYQTTMERLSEITTKLIFFTLELNRIEDAAFAALLAAEPSLAHFSPWLRDVRAARPHQLADEQEQLLHEKQVTGRAAWNRLFDETMADMRFSPEGADADLSLEQTLHLLSEADGAQRKAAAKALGAGFDQQKGLFALITNTLAKDKEIEDKWRKFARPDSARHLSNLVEDEVV